MEREQFDRNLIFCRLAGSGCVVGRGIEAARSGLFVLFFLQLGVRQCLSLDTLECLCSVVAISSLDVVETSF